MGFFSSFFSKMGQSPIAFGRVGAPTITSGNFTMNEGTTTCGTLTATDPNGLDVTFSVRSGIDASLFEITGGNVLSFKDAPDFDNPLDGDGNNVYYVQIRATNTQRRYALKFVTVTVLNVAAIPGDILLSATTVSEDAIVGTEIGTLTAPGLTGDITYSLVTGENDDHNASFAIDVNKLETLALLNYEAVSRMNIRVKATNGTTDIEASFTITVTNIAEAPTNIILSKNTMNEGNEIGDVVADLHIVHQELVYPVPTFTRAAGTGDTDNASFSIDGTQLKAEVVFDYEVKSSYQFRLSASTGGGPAFEKAFTLLILDVNEYPVITSGSAFNVPENTTFVCNVVATDPESQVITYSIQGSQPPSKFAIGASSGVLSFIAAPDYEIPGGINGTNEYKVIVQATDSDGLYAAKEIVVTVTDVNESDIYVDPVAGSDSNIGTALYPLKTKEEALSRAYAGVTIFLSGYDYNLTSTWNLTKSGSYGQNIKIKAWPGTGNVTISGFSTITGFESYSENIYRKRVVCESDVNLLLFDGTSIPIARFPRTGYRVYEAAVGSTGITDTQLSEVASYLTTGSQVVVKKANRYVIDRGAVSGVVGNTVTYTGGSVYDGGAGFGYFIQNSLPCLTTNGDWAYISGYLYVYSSDNITNHTVKVPTFNNLIANNNRSYVSFEDVIIEGANSNLLYFTQANGFILNNCTIRHSGGMGVYVPDGFGVSNAIEIADCVITDIMDCAVKAMSAATNISVHDNVISDIGMVIGMAGNGDGRSSGIFTYGSRPNIYQNTISNIGFNGVVVRGDYGTVKNNVITNTVQIKEDGAGIYVSAPASGVTIHNINVEANIVIGSGSALSSQGVNDEVYRICHGIYLDDTTINVVVTGNTIADCEGQGSMGIYLHNNTESNIVLNNIYNCSYGIQVAEDRRFGHITAGLSVTGNNILCKTSTQVALFLSSNQIAPVANHFEEMGVFDDNRYCRPVDDTTVILTSVNTYTAPNLVTNPIPRTLASYQAYCPSMDTTSTDSPVDSDGTGALLFEYAGHEAESVVLDPAGDWITLENDATSGTVAIQPYSSILLIDKLFAIPLTTGLVSYWDLDETTGAAVDSESGFNGTATGGITQTVNGVTIDADGEYLDCGHHAALDLTTFSISFWMNPATYTPTRYIMGSLNWSTDRYGIGMRIFNEPGTPALDDKLGFTLAWSTGQSTFAVSTNVVPLEELHHWVITYDGVNMKSYKDGVLDLTVPKSNVPEFNSIPWYIGKVYGNTNTFRGLLSRIGVWNTVLTPNAALKLNNSGSGMKYADL